MAQKKIGKPKIFDQIQTNWRWIAVLIACVSAGFWIGQISTSITLNAKISELENQRQLDVITSREKNLELWEKYRIEITDLKNEIIRLEIEITTYKNGKENEN